MSMKLCFDRFCQSNLVKSEETDFSLAVVEKCLRYLSQSGRTGAERSQRAADAGSI